jgi:hypothetical protein
MPDQSVDAGRPLTQVTVRGRGWLISAGFAAWAVLAAANDWGAASGAVTAAAAILILAADGPITIDSTGVHRRWLVGVHRFVPWDDVAGLQVLVKEPWAGSYAGMLTVQLWQVSRQARIPALDQDTRWQMHFIGQSRAEEAAQFIVDCARGHGAPARWRYWPFADDELMATHRFWE